MVGVLSGFRGYSPFRIGKERTRLPRSLIETIIPLSVWPEMDLQAATTHAPGPSGFRSLVRRYMMLGRVDPRNASNCEYSPSPVRMAALCSTAHSSNSSSRASPLPTFHQCTASTPADCRKSTQNGVRFASTRTFMPSGAQALNSTSSSWARHAAYCKASSTSSR